MSTSAVAGTGSAQPVTQLAIGNFVSLQPNSLILVIGALLMLIYFVGAPMPNSSVEPLDYVLRQFFHADTLHLFSNLFALWRVTPLANSMSTIKFVQMLVFLTVFSAALLFVAHELFPSTKRTTVGFSGVLFGLIVVRNYLLGGSIGDIALDVAIQILPNLLQPHISFIGHLTGALTGFAYLLLDGGIAKVTAD